MAAMTRVLGIKTRLLNLVRPYRGVVNRNRDRQLPLVGPRDLQLIINLPWPALHRLRQGFKLDHKIELSSFWLSANRGCRDASYRWCWCRNLWVSCLMGNPGREGSRIPRPLVPCPLRRHSPPPSSLSPRRYGINSNSSVGIFSGNYSNLALSSQS